MPQYIQARSSVVQSHRLQFFLSGGLVQPGHCIQFLGPGFGIVHPLAEQFAAVDQVDGEAVQTKPGRTSASYCEIEIYLLKKQVKFVLKTLFLKPKNACLTNSV